MTGSDGLVDEGGLAGQGLIALGWFVIEDGDLAPDANDDLAGAPALMIGNAGPAMWLVFSQSPEFADRAPDPLDRWTRRVVDAIAAEAEPEAATCYPFGSQLWPFQRWARRATGISGSPLGLLIHPRYGLWLGLRAAIVFPGRKLTLGPVEKPIHPCDKCAARPCLSACPVNALSGSGYDVRACREWLHMPPDEGTAAGGDSSAAPCMDNGCAARIACPVGREFAHGPEQARFHMRAFRGA